MSDWILSFIRQHSKLNSLQAFATVLADRLNSDIPHDTRYKYISGFHISGFNELNIPEFWYVRNVKDDRVTLTGSYEPREDFIRRDAPARGYDGHDPSSIECGLVQTYRNGDIRAHVDAWTRIDDAFGRLLEQPEFRKLREVSDYEEWCKFKMEVIAYFYKKFCNISLVARPIDVFSVTP